MTDIELQRILLVGPPGAGKGSLAPRLSELLGGVPHVSSGQLLRASVAAGDPHHIADQVSRGHLVGDRVVAGFILDGYPRTVRQAQQLDHLLGETGHRVQIVLELIVPDEVASARLSRRARMESRSDDNPETVAARLVTYRREAVVVLAHYGARVRRVSASGDLDEVFERAERALSSLPKGARASQA